VEQVSDSEGDERGGAVGGVSDNTNGLTAGVVVDEQLFEGGFDDIVDTGTFEEGVASSGKLGIDHQDKTVEVDEALFDGEDLEALSLEDDSSNLALPSEDTRS